MVSIVSIGSLIVVYVHPQDLARILPLAGHEVMVRWEVCRAWRSRRKSSCSTVKGRIPHWVCNMLWWMVTTVPSPGKAVCVSSRMAIITMSAVVLLPSFWVITFERIIGIVILWWWVCCPTVVLPLGLTK